MGITGISSGLSPFDIWNTQNSKTGGVGFDAYLEQSLTPSVARQNNNIRGSIPKLSMMPEPRADGNIHIQDIEANTKEVFSVFQTHLKKLFAENGIDTSQEINISTDTSGKVIVTNDHPDKEKIEQIFENNSELANMYRGISANMSLLKAAKEAEAFQREYAMDPKAAVAKYSNLFDDSRSTSTHLNINGDSFDFV